MNNPALQFPNLKPGPKAVTVVGNTHKYFEESTAYMIEDLARSGLSPAFMGCESDPVAPKVHEKWITASYRIPFWDLDGKQLQFMHRTRRRVKESAPKRERVGKYDQPAKGSVGDVALHPYIHPANWEFKNVEVIDITEGEKKSAAILKHVGIPAFGTLGKDVSNHTITILAQAIVKLGVTRLVRLWPDADISRPEVSQSYSNLKERLAATLREMGHELEVVVMRPGWDCMRFKGIDDALAKSVSWEECLSAGEYTELMFSLEQLANVCGLRTRFVKEDVIVLEAVNNDSVTRILSVRDWWGEFWFNEDTGELMLNNCPIDEYVEMPRIVRRVQHLFGGFAKATESLVISCIISICRSSSRSPFRNFLVGLEWDGTPRLGSMLSRACGASDTDFVREAGEKFLSSIVARTLHPGCAVDYVLILSGPGGCGKSSVSKTLFAVGDGGSDNREDFSYLQKLAVASGSKDKDLQMQAGTCRCLVFDELASFMHTRTENEQVKTFITATEDNYRAPFAKAVTSHVRPSVCLGNTNRINDILRHDPSGYRRFVIVEVIGTVKVEDGLAEQFDWEWLETNREQLWAEAVALVKKHGVRWVSQVKGASENAKKHVQASPLESDIVEVLAIWKKHPDNGKKNRIKVRDIRERVIAIRGAIPNNFDNELSRVLVERGCTKTRSSGIAGYELPKAFLDQLLAMQTDELPDVGGSGAGTV